jgi:NADH pyrophosphatase NudC (nudix superfamily)
MEDNEEFKVSENNNKVLHYAVGAIIKKGDMFLLLDRANPPYGWACIAGHIDKYESPEQAIIREVKEEAGLEVINIKNVGEETLDWNWCYKGATQHHWHIFECETSGEAKINQESKDIKWFKTQEIKQLKLEPSWEYWLEKLKII